MTILLSNYSPKKLQKGVFVSNLGIFVFSQILQFDKFADFKYDNSFWNFSKKKYPDKTLLVLNLGIFVISWNFVINKFEGAYFKYDKYVSEFQSKDTKIRHFL